MFKRLFGNRTDSARAPTLKTYEFPSCRAEFALRIQRGESFPEVMNDMQDKWTAGNEFMWDEYDVNSLVDTDAKAACAEHQLLYTRVLLYRSVRQAGQDIRGSDPIEFFRQSPAGFAQVYESFPPAAKEKYAPGRGKKYQYVTGNLEANVRCSQGEALPVVGAEIMTMWSPGNEHLWDCYDLESLIDTNEKHEMAVNQLLYSRITVYRALRQAGTDIRGTDPFDVTDRVPDLFEQLRARFPDTVGRVCSPPSDSA